MRIFAEVTMYLIDLTDFAKVFATLFQKQRKSYRFLGGNGVG
jgi:hypothetical protein